MPSIRKELAQIDKDHPIANIATMEEILAGSVAEPRPESPLLGLFGGLGLVLATLGIYGVMSYAVSQSRRDLGLRMALGADTSSVLRLVLAHGMALTAGGVGLGAAAAGAAVGADGEGVPIRD